MKKLDRNKKDSIDLTLLFQYGLITVLLAIWLPLPFLNFDDHHDGLVLSTVRLTKTALIQGGEYPFNQYGPVWIIPFVLLSLLVPNAYLFLGIRFLTVFFYIISAFLLWKIARLYLDKKLANVVVILFLGSQPFITDYGSSLVPWPSAVIMPIILIISYFSLLQFSDAHKNIKVSKSPLYVGLLIPTIIFSRLQIGILLLLVCFFSLHFSKIYLKKTKFTLGLFITGLSLFIYLKHSGWLREALYDQFIFGSTYLTADKSTFPKPIFTLLGIFIFVAILVVGPKVIRKFNLIKSSRVLIIISLSLILTIIVLLYLISERQVSPLVAIVTLTRRFWITLGLATLIFLSVKILILKIKYYQKPELSGKYPKTIDFLVLYAVSAQIQVIPLFDQMHFWWGSPLTFLILVIIFKERFKFLNFELADKTIFNAFAIVVLSFSIFVPWVAQISTEKVKLTHEIGQHIYTSSTDARYQLGLQKFFHINIAEGAKVLNVCDSPNIFFEGNRYTPASRFFVFWGEQMSKSPGLIQSLINSKPDVVLTCELSYVPGLQLNQEKIQRTIIERIPVNSDSYISYTVRPDKIWRIYKINQTNLNNTK